MPGPCRHGSTAGPALRLLPLLDLLRALLNPAVLRTGDLNLFGVTNPLSLTASESAALGTDRATGRPRHQIIWGSTIYDLQGAADHLGHRRYTVQDNQLIWGNTES